MVDRVSRFQGEPYSRLILTHWSRFYCRLTTFRCREYPARQIFSSGHRTRVSTNWCIVHIMALTVALSGHVCIIVNRASLQVEAYPLP